MVYRNFQRATPAFFLGPAVSQRTRLYAFNGFTWWALISTVKQTEKLQKVQLRTIKEVLNKHTYSFTYKIARLLTLLHTYIHTYIHIYIGDYIIGAGNSSLIGLLSISAQYIHTYIHTNKYAYIHTNIHSYKQAYIHTSIQTYIHTYSNLSHYFDPEI